MVCVSTTVTRAGPVACLALSTTMSTHAHAIKHPGVALAVAHQVQALPRRGLFDMALSPWFRADLA